MPTGDNVVTLGKRETIGDTLRRYAAMADSGELVAFGIIIVHPGKRVGTEYVNPADYGHELLSASAIMQLRLTEALLDGCVPK